jgi:5-bromo-4-chloroindolyl phosphate hydrolysis protein
MDYNSYKEQKTRSKRRWNFIGIGLLIMGISAPIGIGILIANGMDILPNIGGDNVKKSIDDLASDVRRSVNQPVNRPMAEVPEQQKRVNGMPKHGGLITAFGAILAAMGALFAIGGGAALAEEGFSLGVLFATGFSLCLAAAGLTMGIYGHIRKKKKERFEAYLKLIGDKQAVPIHYLADVMGIDYHKVIKDLREMITRGILQPAWLDLKTYRLMMTEYTETQAAQPEEKTEEAISRNDRILRQIRADNDLIADPEVSAKIDRIEDLTRKIFAILEQRPEKEAQLHNFMNYYLPTTLKALESYARLEAQGIETAAIKEAKQKINDALDELADGYEKQLDKLFADDVVDITADIDVMRKMLHKDGLKEDEIVAATLRGYDQ